MDYLDELDGLYSLVYTREAMAFKRSAVRSRFSPPKVLKAIGFRYFFLFLRILGGICRPLEFCSNLMHSRGVVMARISVRNVQKSTVEEYFRLIMTSHFRIASNDGAVSFYRLPHNMAPRTEASGSSRWRRRKQYPRCRTVVPEKQRRQHG